MAKRGMREKCGACLPYVDEADKTPLLRAAMVGGAAYYRGKHVPQGNEREAEQEERLGELEAQRSAPVQATPPPPAGGMTDTIEMLAKLGQLHAIAVGQTAAA